MPVRLLHPSTLIFSRFLSSSSTPRHLLPISSAFDALPSSTPLSLFPFCSSPPPTTLKSAGLLFGSRDRQAHSSAVAGVPTHDTFIAEEVISRASLGVFPRLSDALSRASFPRSSLIRAASMSSVIAGKDVVVAAETGSAKAHCYLVPLIDRLFIDDSGDLATSDMKDDGGAESTQRRDWRRVRRAYRRSKQYIFVAATLPSNGKKKLLGVAVISSIYLGWRILPSLSQPRSRNGLRSTLIHKSMNSSKAVNQEMKPYPLDEGLSIRRTMVFANTVEAVDAVANILGRAGIDCYLYHKDFSLEERSETIINFHEKGGILVCTDAAARSFDIPYVSHDIQADFPTSAVDFSLRVGRTARAGRFGVITSLYTEANRDLVDAVCQAGKLGKPLESAFSRKRSFRNKLKKRGLGSRAAEVTQA